MSLLGVEKVDFWFVVQSLIVVLYVIFVDCMGQCYMNEGGFYMVYCKGMLVCDRIVLVVLGWVVFDSQCMVKYMIVGILLGMFKLVSWYSSGYFKKVDMIVDLVRQIDVDLVVLIGMVVCFN